MNTSRGLPLCGKVALVTGGSRGIGAGIVRRLAADGAAVAFTYVSSKEKAESLVLEIGGDGGSAVAIQADSASETDIRSAMAAAVTALGPLDIFVNSAGLLLGGGIDAVKIEDVDRLWAVNVRAAVIGIQSAAVAMKDGGRIVTIGSVGAVRTGVAGASIYSMTKSALVGLVRGAAIDLAPRAITVNNVQPGPTATDMNPADGPFTDWLLQRIPLGRFGKDAEVAGLVAYLATDEAAFITGASLTVDGGYTA